MSSRSKKVEVHVNVPQDVMTETVASSIVCSLVKFLAVRRQQMPFAYETFISLVRGMPQPSVKPTRWSEIQMQKQRELAQTTMENYEHFFKNLPVIFNAFHVQEVAFFFGETMYTPKEVWQVVFPANMGNHSPQFHARNSQQVAHQAIKAIATHEGLMDNLERQFNPTNMHVMFKLAMEPQSQPNDNIFQKKDFSIPPLCHASKIILENNLWDSALGNCCGNVRIHGDASPWRPAAARQPVPTEGEWYEFKRVIKGFKDVSVQGKSIWNK